MSLVTSTQTFEEAGLVWARQLVGPEQIAELITALAELEVDATRAGLRDLLSRCPAVAKFAASQAVSRWVNPMLGGKSFVVRGLLFDKTQEANWRVAWHQDVTIAVREPRAVTGFGPWSVKDDIPHTHAPASLLERMVTLRLHLDACDETNGALRVLAGSHRGGKLDAKTIEEWKTRSPAEHCLAQAGDALFMRPLLLHASSSADSPKHRRVIHLEYATDELPNGLAWAQRISE